MAIDTIIKNCKLVKPTGIFPLGLGIEGERIVMQSRDEDLPPANRVIDAGGNYIIPGLVDGHMHLPRSRDPKDVRAETQACAAGGCTTIVHMITSRDDLPASARQFVTTYETNGYVDLAFTAMVMDANQIRQIPDLIDYGIRGFKLFPPYRVGTEIIKDLPQFDDGVMYLAFKEIGRLAKQVPGVHSRVHCENIEIFAKLKERFIADGVEPASWDECRPSICEAETIQRAIYLAKVADCPLCIIHVSSGEGIDIVARARADGLDVQAETCPQYLTLNVDNCDRILSKVNPPIRHAEDNERLWLRLKDGTISLVGTDHAPVKREKKAEFWSADVGISVVEFWLPLLLSEGVSKGRISLPRLVELCCFNPAQAHGLTPRKGMLEVGSDADLVIIDLDKKGRLGDTPTYSASDVNVFSGRELTGWPVLTMIRGAVAMQDGQITGSPGYGKYCATGS